MIQQFATKSLENTFYVMLQIFSVFPCGYISSVKFAAMMY